MLVIGKALLSGAASSLCALECDAFHVPLGATDLDLSSKQHGPAAATLLAGVIKGNKSISTLKCVHTLEPDLFRIQLLAPAWPLR